jgi:hypothetical protein
VKLNKHTFFSALFLFIFLSAFSSSAYTSLSNSIKQFSHFSKGKELKEDGMTSASDDLVFEETENDTEESIDPLFILLPAFLNFDSVTSIIKSDFSEFTFIERSIDSIFLSIRVLRI